MEKIRMSSLGLIDEHKFKKLASDREEWLLSGEDMLLSNSYEVNKLANIVQPSEVIVGINKAVLETKEYKTISLIARNILELPLFNPGQKISITLKIDDKYYTKAYTLVSSPNDSLNGKYMITVKNDKENPVDNYLFNEAKKGERIVVSNPFGDFYYNPIRDYKNIIAIANDDGIMAILAMMKAIVEGNLDCSLSLYYSEKIEANLLYKDELIELSEKSDKIKVKIILIDENKKGYLSGYVTTEMLKEDIIENDTSIFISGNEALLKYLNTELEELKLPKKYIRYNSFLPVCNIKRVVKYKLSIYVNNEKYELPCYNNKTIMQALMDGGVYIPSKCHDGSCGFCRSELISGEVKIVNDKRTYIDKKYNYIHPCTTYPLGDIELIIR